MLHLQDNQALALIKFADPIIKRRLEHHTTMIFKALCHLIDGSQVAKAAYYVGNHIAKMEHVIGAELGGSELSKVMGAMIDDGEYEGARVMVLAVCDLCDVLHPSHAAVSKQL